MAVVLLLALISVCWAALPVVDLGYELHQANALNSSHGLYNFSNIRFAAPPVGDLRFRAPVLPKTNRSHIQDGSVGRVCPQALPIWQEDIEPGFLLSLLTGTKFNMSLDLSSYPYIPHPVDPRTSEDCLFLDVITPKETFHRAQSKKNGFTPKKNLVPVLVWIYGGGFTDGDKTRYNPIGLIKRSMQRKEEIVYVALNYRLGAFGWLGGSGLTANGTANAALHDQRLALDWVYKNIHLFGGDPSRVTVMGESAGGGSILHQITAYGGKKGPAPFQQAILQSPAWLPIVSDAQQEQTLQQFLQALNVSSIEEARRLPSDTLIKGNALQIATQSFYGSFVFGPVVDGTFVPAMPGQLLLSGDFDQDLNIMVGHNADEGLAFTSPNATQSSYLATMLKQMFPSIQPNVTRYITEVLYPAKYDGKWGYTNPLARAALTLSDATIQCNTDYLNRAYQNQTYAYQFSIPPALHGQDVLYTFFDNSTSTVSSNLGVTVTNATIAYAMQDWFISFAHGGRPQSSLATTFAQYGTRGQLMNIGNNTITPMRDLTNNPRCRFWQTVPYK
ncbi:hypothetical protein N7532_012085 [Penicillium argentinense]|uniref:Carboxylic ester hydrolase n=1 Tax=Penicillium argentinense TaxID=1131581 RepID=A0A9W9JVV8_9EURO|nr:uncharacterized protein N7532_012085 [Penicillium argentinense]KAJ5083042.1 hypothetical protein N7532_012085 [Penicillium argentinense]